jgi:hypothetical protein
MLFEKSFGVGLGIGFGIVIGFGIGVGFGLVLGPVFGRGRLWLSKMSVNQEWKLAPVLAQKRHGQAILAKL